MKLVLFSPSRHLLKFFTLHSSFFTYLRVAFDANAPPTLSHPLYIINGNYLELVPIHLGLKGQLNLAQGNPLGVRITLHSSALTGQLHKCIVFQSICQTQMLNIFYVAALSGRKNVCGYVSPGCRPSADAPFLCPGLGVAGPTARLLPIIRLWLLP